MKKKMLEKQVYKLCSYQNQSSIRENAMDIEKRSGIETKKIACFGRQIIPVPSVMLVLSPSIASQSDSQFGIYPTIGEGSDESTHS